MFCRYCGVRVDDDCQVCPSCKNVLPKMAATEAKANDNGQQANQAAANAKKAEPYLAGQDKMTMALIAFFLGGLGIHNFMMGETNKGILRLVLTLLVFGVGWIFGLIDFVKILTGDYKVDKNAFI